MVRGHCARAKINLLLCYFGKPSNTSLDLLPTGRSVVLYVIRLFQCHFFQSESSTPR